MNKNTSYHHNQHRPLSACSHPSSSTNKHKINLYLLNPNYSFTPNNYKCSKILNNSKHSTHNNSYRTPGLPKQPLSSDYLLRKHELTVKKIEHMRQEQHNKIENEMWRKPHISSNSRRIVEGLLSKNNSNVFNKTSYAIIERNKINDYIEMVNNRKVRLKEIEEKMNENRGKCNSSSNRKGSLGKNKEIRRVPTAPTPSVISEQSNNKNLFNRNNKLCKDEFVGYVRYDPKEVFGVRNRFHSYYTKMKYKSNNNNNRQDNNQRCSNSNGCNNSSNIINVNEVLTFKRDSERPIKLNNQILNESMKQFYNHNNNNFSDKDRINNNNNNKKEIQVKKIETTFNKKPVHHCKNKNNIQVVNKDKINKRERDLKQFLQFTDELCNKTNINNCSQLHKEMIIPSTDEKKVHVVKEYTNMISKSENIMNKQTATFFKMNDNDINRRMKIIEYNEGEEETKIENTQNRNQLINHMNQSENDTLNDLKLNSRSKAFAQERMMLMKNKQ